MSIERLIILGFIIINALVSLWMLTAVILDSYQLHMTYDLAVGQSYLISSIAFLLGLSILYQLVAIKERCW